jgi:hypothetical protein
MRRPARGPGHAPAAVLVAAAVVLLVACNAVATPGPSSHAGHDPRAERVRAALESELGVTFEPAGPHHVLGTAPDGSEIDLVGVPVEAVVLSVPVDDPEAGTAYLPHVRDLIGGPAPVYEWVAAMLTCRADADAGCGSLREQGNLRAEFTSEGPEFVVVSLSR